MVLTHSHQLIPRFFGRNYWDVFDYPEHLFGQDFGMELDPYVADPLFMNRRRSKFDALQHLQGGLDEGGLSSVRNTRDNFQVSFDVKHFKPEEVNVKYSGDGTVVIHGKHEERSDQYGYISREFTRRYALPEDIEQEKVACAWTLDGVLTINAPKKPKELPAQTNERNIPITMSGAQGRQGQIENK